MDWGWISVVLQALIAITIGAVLNSLMRLRERIVAIETLLVGVKEGHQRHSDKIAAIDEIHSRAIQTLEKDTALLTAFMRRVERQEAGG